MTEAELKQFIKENMNIRITEKAYDHNTSKTKLTVSLRWRDEEISKDYVILDVEP